MRKDVQSNLQLSGNVDMKFEFNNNYSAKLLCSSSSSHVAVFPCVFFTKLSFPITIIGIIDGKTEKESATKWEQMQSAFTQTIGLTCVSFGILVSFHISIFDRLSKN